MRWKVPTGAVLPFAGGSVPLGWLSCNGDAVSRKTYRRLFRVIGVAYGLGDGTTTFNLPDLRDKLATAGKSKKGVAYIICT